MAPKLVNKITPYLISALLVGGCLGTCSLIPKRREPNVQATVETTEFLGVPARVYRNELDDEKTNNRQFVDFKPYGSLDVTIYDGKEARSWLNDRDNRFNFRYLEGNAREQGFIE